MVAAIATVAAVVLAAGLTLMGWMVKTLLDTATMLRATSERLDDIEKRNEARFERLEGVVFEPAWRKGR